MPDVFLETPFPNMARVRQITNDHCGPAAVVMLLSHLGLAIGQEELVAAAGAEDKLHDLGMTVDDMAVAIKTLLPEVRMWSKLGGEVGDLETLSNVYKYPVGVEWQGVFEHEDGNDDDDAGHYSVITGVDRDNGFIRLADPYRLYAGKDRILPLKQFRKRWWDVNEVWDKGRRRRRLVCDERMMFIITPAKEVFPREIDMN